MILVVFFKKIIPKIKLFFGITSDPGRIRTPNPQSRNLIFYPVELLGRHICKFNDFP